MNGIKYLLIVCMLVCSRTEKANTSLGQVTLRKVHQYVDSK